MKHALRSKNALTVCIQEDKTNGEENNCSDFTMIFWCFGSGWVVMYERWSLTRGGHTWRSRPYNNITIIAQYLETAQTSRILHQLVKPKSPTTHATVDL